MKKNYDFVIIGQGIAGTVLSWYLIERNLNFLIINDPKKTASSSAALASHDKSSVELPPWACEAYPGVACKFVTAFFFMSSTVFAEENHIDLLKNNWSF